MKLSFLSIYSVFSFQGAYLDWRELQRDGTAITGSQAGRCKETRILSVVGYRSTGII